VALKQKPIVKFADVSMNLLKAKKPEVVFSFIENTLRKSPCDFYIKGF